MISLIKHSFNRLLYFFFFLKVIFGKNKTFFRKNWLKTKFFELSSKVLNFSLIRKPFFEFLNIYFKFGVYSITKLKSKFNFFFLSEYEITASYIANYFVDCFKLRLKTRKFILPLRFFLKSSMGIVFLKKFKDAFYNLNKNFNVLRFPYFYTLFFERQLGSLLRVNSCLYFFFVQKRGLIRKFEFRRLFLFNKLTEGLR